MAETYRLSKPRKRLGAFISLPNRIYAVEAALKDIIEGLEPGVHQFNPVQILTSKGEPWPAEYFLMVVGRYLDSFRPDQTG